MASEDGPSQTVAPSSSAADIAILIEGANSGNADAQCDLGVAFAKGLVSEDGRADFEEAFRWYEKAARSGHARSMCNLGFAYLRGRGTAADVKKAAFWYENAWKHGSAEGAYCLALMQLENHSTEGTDQFLKWMQIAADLSYGPAVLFLGQCAMDGSHGCAVNLWKAVDLIYRAIQLHAPSAPLSFLTCIRRLPSLGDGFDAVNLPRLGVVVHPMELIRDAALVHGDLECLYGLVSEMHAAMRCDVADIEGIVPLLTLRSRLLPENPADRGRALVALGHCAAMGLGQPISMEYACCLYRKAWEEYQQPTGAASWALCLCEDQPAHDGTNAANAANTANAMRARELFHQAALLGHPLSQYNYCKMQMEAGLTWEAAEIAMLQQAAASGCPEAQVEVGMLFFQGHLHCARDRGQALWWWKKAAEQGNLEGMYNVGEAYLQGWGCDNNQPQLNNARHWLQRAVSLGFWPAKQLLDTLPAL